jgi:phenylacetate-CoA ligase
MSAQTPNALHAIETASRDEIESLQLSRLKSSLSNAYKNVAHYRESFNAAGVTPDDLKILNDLSKFPFLTKNDLRAQYPFGMFAVPRSKVARVHASSGTTGQPTVVGYTATDLSNWADLVARSIHAGGGSPGDLVHVAYGYGLFTGGLGAHYGVERLGATVIPMSGGQTEKQVQLITDFKPYIIMVTPSYMLALAEEFARQGLDAKDCSLRLGIFGAEPWSGEMRSQIEAIMGIDAVDIYGLSEVMGPGVASECVETKDGPTVWEDHFLPEIIDPDTGVVLPDGEEGELVFTSLTKEALPVIRYRTRDRTALLPPTSRSMRRLARIKGRTDDLLIIRGVNLFPSLIEEILLKLPGIAPHYQIIVDRDGVLDTVQINVERSAGARSTDEELSQAVVKIIKDIAGVSVRAKIMLPGRLERSAGKATRVIDRRK